MVIYVVAMHHLHRVFCATPWELEAERRAFQDVISEVNATDAMARGVILVPVSLVNIRDKRPLQHTIDENIRECHGFILALGDGWGPPERHFERDYRVALECRKDPSLPMQATAFLWNRTDEGAALPPGLPAPTAEFTTLDEFRTQVGALLREWLPAPKA